LPRTATSALRNVSRVTPNELKRTRRRCVAVFEQRQRQVFDRDVFVLEPLGLVFGAHQRSLQARRDVHLAASTLPARDARPPFELLLESSPDRRHRRFHARQELRQEPVFLLQKRQAEMLGVDFLVAVADPERLRRLDRFLGFFRQAFQCHPSSMRARPRRRPQAGTPAPVRSRIGSAPYFARRGGAVKHRASLQDPGGERAGAGVEVRRSGPFFGELALGVGKLGGYDDPDLGIEIAGSVLAARKPLAGEPDLPPRGRSGRIFTLTAPSRVRNRASPPSAAVHGATGSTV
jgi:hypothetical protein